MEHMMNDVGVGWGFMVLFDYTPLLGLSRILWKQAGDRSSVRLIWVWSFCSYQTNV